MIVAIASQQLSQKTEERGTTARREASTRVEFAAWDGGSMLKKKNVTPRRRGKMRDIHGTDTLMHACNGFDWGSCWIFNGGWWQTVLRRQGVYVLRQVLHRHDDRSVLSFQVLGLVLLLFAAYQLSTSGIVADDEDVLK